MISTAPRHGREFAALTIKRWRDIVAKMPPRGKIATMVEVSRADFESLRSLPTRPTWTYPIGTLGIHIDESLEPPAMRVTFADGHTEMETTR